MRKKQILFVIDSLYIGGAEKSLISLLNNMDKTKFQIDLLMFKRGGELENFLPNNVKILEPPQYFKNDKNNYRSRIINFIFRVKTSINLRLNLFKKTPLHSEQVVYKSIRKVLTPIKKKYDVAIAYSQGMPTYYVSHKINSYKKLAWINTDYKNTLYNKELDYISYKNFDEIIAVSENTKKSVINTYEDYKGKLDVIMDIVDSELIIKMSTEYRVNEFSRDTINILTVGRLVSVKGFDRAIKVALLLKNAGHNFKWFVVGDGPDRNLLQNIVDESKLSNHFIFLGKKLNPYVYMKNCDIYVQTSLKEGFGLTLYEAKILKKPIVCTNFPTANEIIHHEVDGLIVEHKIESIFAGIERYIVDIPFKAEILKNLEKCSRNLKIDQIIQFHKKIN
ncbi:glycosyltransferase [Bacillus sp. RO2]|uniref:glycosyltransferase n=1 Tax=Bacillus sp. RO2 TaxID=2723913 RepID=UPI00145F3D68|nr:glycosyltransferase [Bacillus sp. RO2]NMH75297.1 glycosyltransferase [Bacillus sp. RO2]